MIFSYVVWDTEFGKKETKGHLLLLQCTTKRILFKKFLASSWKPETFLDMPSEVGNL